MRRTTIASNGKEHIAKCKVFLHKIAEAKRTDGQNNLQRVASGKGPS